MMHTSHQLAFKIWYCLVLVTQKIVIVPQMFYRAYHWQNICAWQVLSCTECFKGTFIFVSLKDLKKGACLAPMGRWGCGAVERQIEFVEPPASSFYCPRTVTEINKEFYFDLYTRHLFQRETGIVEKNTHFKIFQQSLQKNLQKKHDFLFELHRVHWGVG